MTEMDERIKNYWAAKMLDQLMHEGPLITLLRKDIKPPTKWERFTWRIKGYINRVRDAWLVLIGRKDACDPYEF